MPWVINRHGHAKCVPDDERGHYDRAIRYQGCRPVRDEDWNHLNSDVANFAIPWIHDEVIEDGIVHHAWPKGKLGDQPVLIRGCGPSQHQTFDGAFVMHCNPRKNSPDADAMVSIDSIWWTQGRNTGTRERMDSAWVQEWPFHKDKLFFYGPSGSSPAQVVSKNSFRFGMPLHPLKSRNVEAEMVDGNWKYKCEGKAEALWVAHDGAISKVNIVGLCAILLARYLSDGPIILTGFDLKGTHIRDEEHDYEGSQLHRFEKAALAFENVWMHPNNPGPLRKVFPIWEEALCR